MSSREQPRVGIIGAGGIGKTHARAWRENGVTPVAIADVSADAAHRLADETGATTWDDPAAMLAAGKLDIVFHDLGGPFDAGGDAAPEAAASEETPA